MTLTSELSVLESIEVMQARIRRIQALVVVSLVLLVFAGLKVMSLQAEVTELQRSAAIALLSAEAANKKIGAFAPYFGEDKQAFANAWLDESNLPPAVFPDEILTPLKARLESMRADGISQESVQHILK